MKHLVVSKQDTFTCFLTGCGKSMILSALSGRLPHSGKIGSSWSHLLMKRVPDTVVALEVWHLSSHMLSAVHPQSICEI